MKKKIDAKCFTRVISWDDEEKRYIGSLPEIAPNCCHGDTATDVAAQLDAIAEKTLRSRIRRKILFDPPGSALVIIRHAPSNSDSAAYVWNLRRSLGLNQGELAKALGVSQSTLSKWETGSRRPDALAWKLLRMLHASPDLLSA